VAVQIGWHWLGESSAKYSLLFDHLIPARVYNAVTGAGILHLVRRTDFATGCLVCWDEYKI